ncbi:MAG: ROK family protein [Chthoniobacterales bacterium]
MPLRIDFHVHSFFSMDGVSSPEDLIAAARAAGLNGFAITDHNTCDAVDYMLGHGLMRKDGKPVDGFLVIPGVEVTTADGHLLCLGCNLASSLKGKPPGEVCELAHKAGGICVAPHPYDLFRAGIREEKEMGWQEWGEKVGEVVARLAALLNPDLFIIGGGVSRKADKFIPVVQAMVKTPIVPAQLQNAAGLVGAAAVAADIHRT